MEVALPLRLRQDSRLFQQVGLDLRSAEDSLVRESNLDELSEPGGVVVSDGPCVPKGLENGVGLENLHLEGRGLDLDLGGDYGGVTGEGSKGGDGDRRVGDGG